MTRARKLGIAFAAIVALAAAAVLGVFVLIRSDWFYNKVREKIVTTAENATGGRVELNSFRFDWKQLRAHVSGFTLHGTEPAASAPLFHADSVTVGIRIISIFGKDVSLQSLDVQAPRIHLIVGPDGRDNIPHPKVPSRSGLNPLQTVLKVKVGSFALHNGVFEIEKQGSSPFDLQGQNLKVDLAFDPTIPRYRGDVTVAPLHAVFTGVQPVDLNVTAAVSLEGNRIGIESSTVTTSNTIIKATGSLEDLAALHGAFRYDARSTNADIVRIFRLKLLDGGQFQSTGAFHWLGGSNYSADGRFHAYGLSYRGPAVRLEGFTADGALSVTPKGPDVSGVRLSGSLTPAFPNAQPIHVDTQVAAAQLRGEELTINGIALAGLGGSFNGNAHISRFDRFSVEGQLEGFDVKRAAGFYSSLQLPWDGLASGDAKISGEFKNAQDLNIAANLTIVPADPARPVNGQIALNYNAADQLIDLGQSHLNLPSSRTTFSGTIGKALRVHAETRDLNDILPAFGESAAQFPVKLQNGQAVFDGSLTGSMDQPQLQGHIMVSNAVYNGELIESLVADATASSKSIRLDNASVSRGPLRAAFNGTVALADWKLADANQIFGSAAIQNAPAADLATVARLEDFPLTGTVTLNAQISGSIGQPIVSADLAVTRGALKEEAFDRFTGHVNFHGRTVELANGAVLSGAKQIQLSAAYLADNDRLDSGRLQFKVSSNAMPVEQVQTLAKERPGAKGVLQMDANGILQLNFAAASEPVRIADLHATIAATSLQLDAQPLGDLRVTAETQNGSLHAQLQSNFANSSIQGSGDWQLTGDYPGHAVISFSQLDFTRLREWLTPGGPASPEDVIGAAEGQVTVDGPALKLDQLRAKLTIPQFRLSSKRAPDVNGSALTLVNSGPISASLANSIVTVDSARLTARATDLSITGRVNLKQKSGLDLRVNGNVDLAIMHELSPDVLGSGTVSADAQIRGDLSSPQVNGRVQFQNAAFNIVDVPNGLSNASGTILFAGNRATIQSFTGDTGGGKVRLSGFATYSNGEAVFRIHAQAEEVRVRVQGLSIVADAGLNFTGTNDHSMLTGSVTVLRTSFNTETDFGSIIAGSAQPVQTPAARTGLLGGLGFDVQINTSPDIQVQTSLTEDLQLDGNLHLRGTASNPAILGRVNVTQGAVVFFGTKFNIGSGSVAFYNPVKIAPVLDLSLVTKARGIDVTLTISGPIDKLTLTPQSDPPLQFSEIVALLATGRAPTSDPALLTQSASDQPAFQQLGASALLGQAIATPVAGRLQRFFGVSKLRINPTLPGVDVNPQARLTLEQQVTPNITFTYITNVTSTNPQVIQVEWALNKHWSAVALREENGMTGLDFFFKKTF
jgi:translocation and assembly module TamB